MNNTKEGEELMLLSSNGRIGDFQSPDADSTSVGSTTFLGIGKDDIWQTPGK